MLAPSTVYSKANWLKYFLERHMAINKIGNGDFAVGQMTSYSSLRTVLLLGFITGAASSNDDLDGDTIVRKTRVWHMLISKGPCYFSLKILLHIIFIHLFVSDCARLSLLCRLFSSYGKWGLIFNCDIWASLCSGFSCCRAMGSQYLRSPGLEHRLDSCGTRA